MLFDIYLLLKYFEGGFVSIREGWVQVFQTLPHTDGYIICPYPSFCYLLWLYFIYSINRNKRNNKVGRVGRVGRVESKSQKKNKKKNKKVK